MKLSKVLLASLLVLQQLFFSSSLLPLLQSHAALADGYNLWVEKTAVTTNPVPGSSMIYRIDYRNLSGDAISGIVLTDTYGSGLTYSGLISSNPNISSILSHNPVTRTLIISGASLPANTTGTLMFEFIVNTGFTGTELSNVVACNSLVQDCSQEIAVGGDNHAITVPNSSLSTSSAYDLQVTKHLGLCTPAFFGTGVTCTNTQTTYASGDTVYFTVEIKRNAGGPASVSNVAMVDRYTAGLKYVQTVSSTIGNGLPYAPLRQISFSSGFSMISGQRVFVQLEFLLLGNNGLTGENNVAEVGVMHRSDQVNSYIRARRNLPLMIPHAGTYFLANSMETTNANNLSNRTIARPTYDIQVVKSLLAGTVGFGNQLTYRVTITNNSSMTWTNIGLLDMFTPSNSTLVSYTYGPGMSAVGQPTIGAIGTFIWTGITLAPFANGYIDMVIQYPDDAAGICTSDTLNTAIVGIDGVLDGSGNNDTNTSNNRFVHDPGNLTIPSGNCSGGNYDLSISVTADKTNVCIGDIVTYDFKLSHVGKTNKYIKLENYFNNSLEFLDVVSVDEPTRYAPMTGTQAWMSSFLTLHDATLDANPNANFSEYPQPAIVLGGPTNDQTFENLCPVFLGSGSVFRNFYVNTQLHFKNTYYTSYQNYVAGGKTVFEAMRWAYADAYSSTYQYIKDYVIDESAINAPFNQCLVAIASQINILGGQIPNEAYQNAMNAYGSTAFDRYSLLMVVWPGDPKRFLTLNYLISMNTIQSYIGLNYSNIMLGVDYGADSEDVVWNKAFNEFYNDGDMAMVDLSGTNINTINFANAGCTSGCDLLGYAYYNSTGILAANLGEFFSDYPDSVPNPILTYNIDHARNVGSNFVFLEGYSPSSLAPTYPFYTDYGYMLPAGATNRSYKVRYRVKGGSVSGTNLVNTGVIGMERSTDNTLIYSPETIPGPNNFASAGVIVNNCTSVLEDLSVTQTCQPSSIALGDAVVCTVNYCNKQNIPLSGGGLSYTFNNNILGYVGVNGQLPSNTYTTTNDSLYFSDISLNPLECGAMYVHFYGAIATRTNPNVKIGIDVGGTLSFATDVLPSDNSANASIVINALPANSPGTFSKTLSSSFTNSTGSTLTYSISYTNSSSKSHTVDIVDTYATGDLTYSSATLTPTSVSAGSIKRDNQIVPSFSSLTFSISFVTNRVFPAGYVVNNLATYSAEIGEICYDVFDGDLNNNTASVYTPLSGPSPIPGVCNATITNQIYYTGNLPATGDLCSSGTLSGLTQTGGGRTWSCDGLNGGSAQTGCSLAISYCGDGIIGTGIGYTGQEQCEVALQGGACNASCQLVTPVCNGLIVDPSTIFPGGSTIVTASGSSRASGTLYMDAIQVALGNPISYGTSLNTLGTYNFTYILNNPYSGALVSSTCSGTLTVTAAPIPGVCNATITNQIYYTGNLPATGDLCSSGTLSGLTQTESGRTWTCEGVNGGSAQTGCSLAISYCGDGIIGTGIGYTGQEQCEVALQGGACNASCQLVTPVCNGLIVDPSTIFPGGSTTVTASGSSRASGILYMDAIQVSLGNPISYGTSLNTLGTYNFTYILNNPYSGALVSSTCSGTLTVTAAPIPGVCNATITNQIYYTGNLPATGDLCSSGTLSGLTQTESGRTWTCEGVNGGSAQTGCSLAISYCGDGIIGTGIGYTGQEQCDLGSGNGTMGSTCSLSCQILPYDLALRKVLDGASSGMSGDIISFAIQIYNQGSVAASGVQITDYIPDGLVLVSTGWTNIGSGMATYNTLLSILPGDSTTIYLDLIIDGSVTGTITNRSEISIDDGADTDSTPDTTNGTGTESTLDDEINNGSGDEDDHDRASLSVVDTPINGMCNAAMLSQTYYTGNLPELTGLCLTGNLTGLTQTESGRTWSCEGVNGGSTQTGCSLAISYCGDGILGTGNGYTNQEQYDDGNNVDGDGVSATCQLENPSCVGVSFAPVVGNPGLEVFATLLPQTGFSYTDLDWTEVLVSNPTNGTSHIYTSTGTYPITVTLSNDLSGALSILCTGEALITDAPITGVCAYTGQSFYSGSVPNSGTRCSVGTPTNINETASGITRDCEGVNGGATGMNCSLVIEYCGDGVVNGSGEVCEPANTSTCDVMCQPLSYDLALVKSLSGVQTTFVSGDALTFAITVTNQGAVYASGIIITDYLPAGLTLNDAAWLDNNDGTATFIAPLFINTGSSQTISISFIVDGSVTGTITNRSEISLDDGADTDSTPDTTNGTGTESTLDDEINNGSGDEDDHDRASLSVVDTPINGMCNAAMLSQTYYTGNLPELTGLCLTGNLTGLTQTESGRTWSCEGVNGGSTQTGCSLAISYCGDGILGTGNGYTNQEQYDDGNNVDGDGVSATCQLENPSCVGVSFAPVVGNPGLEVFATLLPQTGFSYTDLDWTEVLVSNPTNGTSHIYTSTGAYPITVTLSNDLSGALSILCTGEALITDAPITGVCAYTGQSFYSGSVPNSGTRCSVGTPTNINETASGITRDCEGVNGGATGMNCSLVIEYCGDGVVNGSGEVCEPANTSTCDVMCQPLSYDLALVKSLSGVQTTFVSGDALTFAITVTNQGAVYASGIIITDYLPAGLTLNDAAWLDNNDGTATFIAPLFINTGSSQTISISFIVDGSVTGTITNRSEISIDDGADTDSTPDTTNGTGTESTLDDEINNGSGDEDDHDRASLSVVDTPINGMCNAAMLSQTYYTGNLPELTGLCLTGNLTGLTQTESGRTWSCEGVNGGSTQTGCSLAISYCGDGILGTGNGYTNQEQYDDGNNVDGDGVSATCQLENPSCVGVSFAPVVGNPGLEVFATLLPQTGFSYTDLDWTEVLVSNPTNGTSYIYTNTGTYPITVTLSNDHSGALSILCTGEALITDAPITGVCAYTGQSFYSGSVPTSGTRCSVGTPTNINETASGITRDCEGVNGGATGMNCSLVIEYCGDGVVNGSGEVCEPANTSTCDVMCQPLSYDLALVKSLSGVQTTFVSGDALTFAITVTNQGAVYASGIIITDYLPAGLTLNDAAWLDNNDGTATFIAPLFINTGSSQTISISFIVDGSVTGTITNRSEISLDDGADTDSTPDTTNGTGTESTLDDEINNGSGDEDDHDRASLSVVDTPINGMCNAAMLSQTYYTGNLPELTGLCLTGNLTGLTQTESGRTWSCEGVNGGSTQTGCSLAISYCGDGILGTGNGYTNQEQYDDGNNVDGDGVSATCQLENPSCVGVSFAPVVGNPGLEVFATLLPQTGFSYTDLDWTEVLVSNPTNGTSHIYTSTGTYPITVTLSNDLSGALSILCTGEALITDAPITGVCAYTGQSFYSGSVPTSGTRCSVGTPTNINETASGITRDCEGVNGGATGMNCSLVIEYCGDGVVNGSGEVCEPANTSTCDVMCQPLSYDLALVKSLSGVQTTFVSGDALTFAITVTNQGAVYASGIIITDYLPAGLTLNDAAWLDNNDGTATFIAPLFINTGSSQTISISFIVDGSVTGTITNRSEISLDDGADTDSTPDTTNGTGTESTLDDEINNGSGDEDDHDRASLSVVDTPINGMCNAAMLSQTYYTGNLPELTGLCLTGNLTGLTQTESGRTWSCEGVNGGSTQTGCSLAISYCGDGILGTGNGYTNQEQYDDGNNVDGDGVSATCQLENPSCVGVSFAPVVGNPGLEVFATLLPQTGFSYTDLDWTEVLVSTPTNGTSYIYTNTGTYPITVTLSNDLSGALSILCTGEALITDAPITGVCAYTGQSFYSGSVPNSGARCSVGTPTNINETASGITRDCEGVNGGATGMNCSLVIEYCGDGVVNGSGEVCEPANTSTCDVMCQPLSYDLALVKSLSGVQTTFVSGDALTFAITVTNQGAVYASGIIITDYLPAGLTLNDAAWLDNNDGTATFIAPLFINTGSSQTISISFIVDGSVTGTITNRSEISLDDGADTDSTPDTTNGTGTESTLDDEINNGSGDEDDHDRASLSVVDTSINGMCNAAMLSQTYYTGNLPELTGLCLTGNLTGLTQTESGRTWSCEGVNGGSTQTGCSLAISYCGDGILGTGNGYTNQEQYDDGNNVDGDGVSATCQLENPSCVGVSFAPVVGNPGLEVFATLLPQTGFSYTDLDWTEVLVSTPTNGTSHIYTNTGTYPITVTLSNDLSGALSILCTGEALITDAPITGVCAYTGQSFYSGSVPTSGTRCSVGTPTNINETASGITRDCEGVNGGATGMNCSLVIEYCGDGVVNGSGEVCEPANTSTCDVMCQPLSYDLALVKSLSGVQTTFVSGDALTFAITVTNQGAVYASGIIITDYLPAGLTLNDAAWLDNNDGTATFIAPLFINTGSSQTISISFIVDGSVTGTITNRSEISLDDGADTDSTPDTTNGTGTESTLDDEINNGSGDEDDHDRASLSVVDTPINGMCNAAMLSQTYYTGNLPELTGLCLTGNLTGLTQTESGRTWSCEGVNGGSTQTGCSLAISYCGDGILGTGNGYTNQEQYDDGNNVDGDGVSATCQLENPSCVGVSFAPVVGNPGLEVFATLLPQTGFSYTDLDWTEVLVSNPTNGTSHIYTSTGTYPITVTLSNDLSGALSILCTGEALITDAPITGVCAYTGQSFYSGSVPTSGTRCSVGTPTNINETASGITRDCEGVNGGATGMNCSLVIEYCGDGVVNGSGEVCEPANTSTCDVMCQPLSYDLALVKSLSGVQTTFVSGDALTFAITVTNQGAVYASGIIITDYLPAGLTLNDAAWLDNNDGTATFIAPLFINTGSSQTISISFIVDGSVTGTITNRSEISIDDGADTDSTPDTTNGTGTESTLDDEINNGSGDEDDHDRASLSVVDTPINGMCNAAMLSQTYYTGNLPELTGLCLTGNLTGLTQTESGRTWSCEGVNGGSTQTGCSLAISYCGDGILGTGNGYTNQEQYDDGNNVDGDGVSATCQLENPSCVGVSFAPVVGNPGLEVFATLLPQTGFSYTDLDWTEVLVSNPTNGTSHIYTSTGTYPITVTLSNDLSGALSILCTGEALITDAPITGVCAYTGQSFYSGSVPTSGTRCSVGTPTNINETASGITRDCEGVNGGATGMNCSLVIEYCGDGVVNGSGEVCEPANTSTCDVMCQPLSYDLALVKSLSGVQTTFVSGDALTFAITVTNQGAVYASGIIITDYLPAGLTLNDAAWLDNNDGTATFIAPLFINTGSSQTISISFIVDGSVTGTITNRSEISIDDGADTDSTPDTTNGTGTESTLDDEINNGSGDEDDHDRASLSVVEIRLCTITGTVYLDTNSNTLFDIGDVVQSGVLVTLTGSNGYVATGLVDDDKYAFTGLNCDLDYTASFVNSTLHTQDSSQYEYSGQQIDISRIFIPATSFLTKVVSPSNNFGLIPVATPGTFDLALLKTLVGTTTVFNSGEQVTFTISVTNQGTITGNVFTLMDYIPLGLTLSDSDWTASGTQAIYVYSGILAPGASMGVDISFVVDGSVEGVITNRAEIDADDNDDIDSIPGNFSAMDLEDDDDYEAITVQFPVVLPVTPQLPGGTIYSPIPLPSVDTKTPVYETFINEIKQIITKVVSVRDEVLTTIEEIVMPEVLPSTGAGDE